MSGLHRRALSTDSALGSSSTTCSPSKIITFPHRMERSPLSPLDVLALAPRSPEKAQSDFEAHHSPGWSFVYREDEPYFDFPRPPQDTPRGGPKTADKSAESIPLPRSCSKRSAESDPELELDQDTNQDGLFDTSPERPAIVGTATKRHGLLSLSRKKSKPAPASGVASGSGSGPAAGSGSGSQTQIGTRSPSMIDFSSSPRIRRGLFSSSSGGSPSKSSWNRGKDKLKEKENLDETANSIANGPNHQETRAEKKMRTGFAASQPPPIPSKDDHSFSLGPGQHRGMPTPTGTAVGTLFRIPLRPATAASHYPSTASGSGSTSTINLSLPTPPLSAGSTAPSTPGLPPATAFSSSSAPPPALGSILESEPGSSLARPHTSAAHHPQTHASRENTANTTSVSGWPSRGFSAVPLHVHAAFQTHQSRSAAAASAAQNANPEAYTSASASTSATSGPSRPARPDDPRITATTTATSSTANSSPRRGAVPGPFSVQIQSAQSNALQISQSARHDSASSPTRSRAFPRHTDSRDVRAGEGSGAPGPEHSGMQRQLRERLMGSLDSVLAEHFARTASEASMHSRHLADLERESQEAAQLISQLQRNYTVLETTLSSERTQTTRLKSEVASEKELRHEAISESTTLISRLEHQLSTSCKSNTSLQSRVSELESQLTQAENRARASMVEADRRNRESIARAAGKVEKLEKEVKEWRARAEEGEFTVKALREEGVRMGKELGKRGEVITELEKGRRFVMRV